MTRRVRISAAGWLSLTFVGVFAYFDWITHRALLTTVLLAGLAAGLIVFWKPLLVRLELTETVAAMPTRLKPVLASLPGLVYFLTRGQGTSKAGGTVLFSMVVVVGISVLLGPAIDRRLVTFYRTRNRILPRPARMALAIVLPVLVAFIVIHGSLADLPAMFGGSTRHHQSPYGHNGRFFFGTLLSAALAWALLRDAQPTPTPTPTPTRTPTPTLAAAAPTLVPATGWHPTHVIPAGGLMTWSEPSPSAPSARVDAGLPVVVIGQVGGWLQVRSQDGWTGWVDARSLPPAGGPR